MFRRAIPIRYKPKDWNQRLECYWHNGKHWVSSDQGVHSLERDLSAPIRNGLEAETGEFELEREVKAGEEQEWAIGDLNKGLDDEFTEWVAAVVSHSMLLYIIIQSEFPSWGRVRCRTPFRSCVCGGVAPDCPPASAPAGRAPRTSKSFQIPFISKFTFL